MKAKSALHAAREVIRRDMHSYDSMANKPRYRREAAKPRQNPSDIGLQHEGLCAHNILLIKPCDKCHRSEADALRDYGHDFISKLSELLKKAKA